MRYSPALTGTCIEGDRFIVIFANLPLTWWLSSLNAA
jgi:hypothetical protein